MEYLQIYCRENHISFMILDPDVPVRINGIPEKTGQAAADVLKSCGLKQKKTKGFEQIQAGSVFRVRWEHQGAPSETCENIFAGFDKKTRYNIKVAQRRGLSVEVYDRSKISEDTIGAFCDLMRQTARRDHFIPRDRDYFLNMMENLYPNAKLFLVRYDPAQDLARTRDEMVRLTARLAPYRDGAGGAHPDKSPAKRAEMEMRLKGLGERCARIEPMLNTGSVYLSGSIMTYWGDKSWYMYGASADYCRDTMPNYLLQWEMIRYSVELGLRMYDLRGVPAFPIPKTRCTGCTGSKRGSGAIWKNSPVRSSSYTILSFTGCTP